MWACILMLVWLSKLSTAETLLDQVRTFRNEAIQFRDKNQFHAALGKLKEAILTLKKMPLPDGTKAQREHVSFHSQMLYDYGYTLQLSQQYEPAVPVFKEAMDLTNKVFGDTHPSYTMAGKNLAECYMQLQRYADAIALYKMLRRHMLQGMGAQHEVYMATTIKLSEAYMAENKYKTAVNILQTQLNKLPDEPSNDQQLATADIYLHLSKALARSAPIVQVFEESFKYAKLASRLFKQIKGATSTEYAFSLNNQAGVLSLNSELEKAKKLLKRALKIVKKIYPEDHPLVEAGTKNLKDLNDRIARQHEKTEL